MVHHPVGFFIPVLGPIRQYPPYIGVENWTDGFPTARARVTGVGGQSRPDAESLFASASVFETNETIARRNRSVTA